MKLTWFAGTTIRIHIGGAILVADAELAPGFIDREELVSGADRRFGLAAPDLSIPDVDPAAWRPRLIPKVIDDAETPPVALHRISPGAILVDAPGEPPLVLLTGAGVPRLGRWALDAVVVLFGTGEEIIAAATALLDVSPLRLIALAADEQAIDIAIGALREHLDGTALVSLEPGLALEV